MDIQEYHEKAMRTKADYESREEQLVCAVLGILGEGGELAEIVKKACYQGHTLSIGKVADELGDILWYWHLAVDAMEYVSPSTVAKRNIEKLRNRYPNGFEAERSVNREE